MHLYFEEYKLALKQIQKFKKPQLSKILWKNKSEQLSPKDIQIATQVNKQTKNKHDDNPLTESLESDHKGISSYTGTTHKVTAVVKFNDSRNIVCPCKIKLKSD